MIQLKWIQNCIKHSKYYFSAHGDAERKNDNLQIHEIEEAILSGQVLEQYADTGRGKSCLIAGYSKYGKPIHTICGRRGSEAVIITVYIPKPPKFKNPYQRGTK